MEILRTVPIFNLLAQTLIAVWKISIIIFILPKWKQIQRDVPQNYTVGKWKGQDSNSHVINSKTSSHHPELLPY